MVGLHLECLDLELPDFPLFRIKTVLPLTFQGTRSTGCLSSFCRHKLDDKDLLPRLVRTDALCRGAFEESGRQDSNLRPSAPKAPCRLSVLLDFTVIVMLLAVSVWSWRDGSGRFCPRFVRC